jgi:hypothetical protein
LYSQIKVGNPNADVFAYGGGGPFHYSDFANGFVTRISPFGGHKWTEITDGISFHEYGTVGSGGPAAKGESKPEYLFMRAKGGMDIFRSSRPNCRFWLTESSWNAAGDSISYPQTTVARYLGRYCFLLRTLPGLEIFSYYQLIDVDPNGWGLHVNKATPKLQAAAYKDALSVLHHVTNASLYQHATAPVQLVAMRMDDGTNRVCVWGNDWKWQSGYQGAKTSNDQSGIVPITITSAAKGTLSMKAIGGAATTHPVDPGTHEIPVSYNPTATVLSADVAITFEGLPPA